MPESSRKAPSHEAPQPAAGFPRAHRLKKQRLIRPLFDRSRSDVGTVAVGSVRLLFRTVPRSETDTDAPLQIGFAPGRRRTAVERNRIKRIMRETYRKNQRILTDVPAFGDEMLTVMVVFRGRSSDAAARLPLDLNRAMHRLAERYAADGSARAEA